MLINKLIVTIVIGFSFIVIVSTQAPSSTPAPPEDIFVNSTESCEAIVNETAILVKPVLLIGSSAFPTTLTAIDDHCKLGTDVYKRVRKYGKCLQGLGRQALLIYLHGMKQFLRSICNSPTKKQEAIEDLRCASAGSLEGWNHCLNAVNQQLAFIAKNSTSVGVVGDVCCIYSTVLTCIDQKIGTTPGCSTTADTTKFFKTSINLILREVVELICTRDCTANNPEGLDRIKAAGLRQDPVEGAYLLTPLLDIVSKLSDDTDTN